MLAFNFTDNFCAFRKIQIESVCARCRCKLQIQLNPFSLSTNFALDPRPLFIGIIEICCARKVNVARQILVIYGESRESQTSTKGDKSAESEGEEREGVEFGRA